MQCHTGRQIKGPWVFEAVVQRGSPSGVLPWLVSPNSCPRPMDLVSRKDGTGQGVFP